jgi:hypothetical protein
MKGADSASSWERRLWLEEQRREQKNLPDKQRGKAIDGAEDQAEKLFRQACEAWNETAPKTVAKAS